jgi:molybdopterin-containing oxidoreductase family iron-sulfur binding subunit
MEESRRGFLKIAGVTVLGGVAVPAIAALTSSKQARHGKRLAMVVDLRRCLREKGCRACVTACHRTHNVPDLSRPELGLDPLEVRRREVKWIWKEPFGHAFPSEENPYLEDGLREAPVLVFCNHCDNPACVRVCPTKATWKRPEDGVVMMDMHRCIGCRYCVVACPYGSRSFNWRDPRPLLEKTQGMHLNYPHRSKGVVEKCNFCEERLTDGLPPACVAACTAGALTFGDLEDPSSAVRQLLRGRYAIRRKPELGTDPQVYYLV